MKIPKSPQFIFAKEYVESDDIFKAYKKAYDTSEMDSSLIEITAKALLKNPSVATIIIDLQMKSIVTEEKVLAEYAKIGFSDIRELFNDDGTLKSIHGLSNSISSAVQSVKVTTGSRKGGNISYIHEIKLWPKLPALEALIKRMGVGDGEGSLADDLHKLAERLPD